MHPFDCLISSLMCLLILCLHCDRGPIRHLCILMHLRCFLRMIRNCHDSQTFSTLDSILNYLLAYSKIMMVIFDPLYLNLDPEMMNLIKIDRIQTLPTFLAILAFCWLHEPSVRSCLFNLKEWQIKMMNFHQNWAALIARYLNWFYLFTPLGKKQLFDVWHFSWVDTYYLLN